jgi:sugar/nucleoside kinase (ribokinase family)
MGHAVVDVLAPSPDGLLAELGLTKGTMALVEGAEAERIHAALGPATEASGGSAANTAACLASLGTSCRFVGKVASDTLGEVFAHDLRAAGVRFDGPPAERGSTGRSLVLVTPDGERTMCTDLGVGAALSPADVPADAVRSARALYVEGYLYGKQPTGAAVDEAVSVARRAGTLVAFSASDPGWAAVVLDDMRSLLDRVDLLFANEAEALLLSGSPDVDSALAVLRSRCPSVVVTRGAGGCVVATGGEVLDVPAAPVGSVVDTTGAGDSFAAGYLHGLVSGLGPRDSARVGALVAAEVVGHLGARPLTPLGALVPAPGAREG